MNIRVIAMAWLLCMSFDVTGQVAVDGSQHEKEFCFNCYDENYAEFVKLLAQFQEAQKKEPPRNLPKIDDFYVSRVGVLIHEECFDGRYDFDVEKAVTDSVVKLMTCQVNLVKDSEKYLNTKGQSFYSHIPGLVNLFTSSTKVDGGVLLTDSNNKPALLKDPCRSYKDIPSLKDMNVKADCKYIPVIALGVPKIICQRDQFTEAVDRYWGKERSGEETRMAYASHLNHRDPIFVNYKGKTKVYSSPVVGFVKHNMSEVVFKSTVAHEFFHNLNHSHKDIDTPDYAYFCEAACFGDEYPKGRFTESAIGGASEQCVLSKKKNERHDEYLSIIKEMLSY